MKIPHKSALLPVFSGLVIQKIMDTGGRDSSGACLVGVWISMPLRGVGGQPDRVGIFPRVKIRGLVMSLGMMREEAPPPSGT